VELLFDGSQRSQAAWWWCVTAAPWCAAIWHWRRGGGQGDLFSVGPPVVGGVLPCDVPLSAWLRLAVGAMAARRAGSCQFWKLTPDLVCVPG
jgi:hypothetical protein